MSEANDLARKILGLVVGETDRSLPSKTGHGRPSASGVTVEAATKATTSAFLFGRARQIADEIKWGHPDGDTSGCERCSELRSQLEDIAAELKPMLPPGDSRVRALLSGGNE